ncbi:MULTISPECIES: hypothetical protein [Vibrio]|uniref:hypothetical protein n=1 Tax=Vibrio TaxID=662 RepID=UPI001B829623|nr:MULTISPECIES: hypothetical protein [Vibrio]ELI5395198.1 hypothetical protein [Vibrio parahaemolyticus]EIL2908416.1 hypothetical protein [Vibrio alginolyticus]EJS0370559.1 hypothetical protein [Vibrio alginolyticus]ELA7355840.1 hypothetical protein [Vibrio alginolyticus]ELA8260029.1 hypothetical protein [Vibrio alginolyticus]
MELSERLKQVDNLRRAAMGDAKFKAKAKQHEAALKPKSRTLPKSKPRSSFADWAGGK